jgi:uncharacterized repeat protein (TIGR01451 family)
LPESADLAVTSTFSPNPVPIGGRTTITVTAINYGPADASEVVLTNVLPASFYLVSAVPSKGVLIHAGSLITCSVGGLTNGEPFSLTIVGNPTASGVLSNLAGLAATQPDANPVNNLSGLALPISAPVLRIQLAGDLILVSWPNLAVGYVLQSSLSVGPEADWQPEDMSMVQVFNGENVMIYSLADLSGIDDLFFRLAKP